MTILPNKDAPSQQSVWDVPKVRQCLSCEATFHSEWSGERICPRCKTQLRGGKGHRGSPILPAGADDAPHRKLRSIGLGSSKGIDVPEPLSRQNAVRPAQDAALIRFSSSRSETTMMTGLYPTFENNHGVAEIWISVRDFCCIGASPPQDHPHVYINMGEQDMALCPYCATRYRYDPGLGPIEADPQDSLLVETGA